LIIGICGKKRSGKDTVADILVKEYGFTKYAFADPIKEICRTAFLWDSERINGPEKEVIDPQWGLSPREAMQRIGTELFQVELGEYLPDFKDTNGRLLWARRFKYWYENINDNQNVVVSDVRFKHEHTILIDLDALFLKISRPNFVIDPHSSESNIDSLSYDYKIDNDKDLGDLVIKTHEFMSLIE